MRFDGLGEMLRSSWYLGLTSFGGPAVHFQIVCIAVVRGFKHEISCLSLEQFHQLFVEKYRWIDEQMVRLKAQRRKAFRT